MEKFGPIAEQFLHPTLGTKRITPCAGAQKIHARKWCLFLCVSLCLRSQLRFDRFNRFLLESFLQVIENEAPKIAYPFSVSPWFEHINKVCASPSS